MESLCNFKLIIQQEKECIFRDADLKDSQGLQLRRGFLISGTKAMKMVMVDSEEVARHSTFT